jgi:hypothetical protein
MLKLSMIELFLRLVPEALFLILAGYAFSKTKVNRSKYILSSILFGSINYLIRLLPIDYGVHTILGLICYVILLNKINNISLIKAIQVSFISTIIMFICEGISIAIIQFVLKKDVNAIFSDPLLKIIYGVPSLLIFGCIICAFYFVFLKRRSSYNLREISN